MNRVQQIIQKFNIPQQIQNDPHQIVDYLVQNGSISQDKLNQAIQMAQKMGIKL
jgi:hypothetical protein